MSDLVERLTDAEFALAEAGLPATRDLVREAADRITAFEESLTPSADTKAAYMGEFSMRIEHARDDCNYQIPWTTIKQIMRVIHTRAATRGEEG